MSWLTRVCTKIGVVSKGRGNFCEVSNGDWAVDAQTVRFKEDTFSLQPSKEISIRAAEFDVT